MQIKAKITEKDIKNQITDYLTVTGWGWHPNVAGKLYVGDRAITHPGISDLTAMKEVKKSCPLCGWKYSQCITPWIEVKRPGTGKQSKTQKEFEQYVESHGGIYILARCIEDLQERGI